MNPPTSQDDKMNPVIYKTLKWIEGVFKWADKNDGFYKFQLSCWTLVGFLQGIQTSIWRGLIYASIAFGVVWFFNQCVLYGKITAKEAYDEGYNRQKEKNDERFGGTT